MIRKTVIAVSITLALAGLGSPSAGRAFAAHPLITDDTGTQGKGRYQVEINTQYDAEKETSAGVKVKETGGEAAAILAAGVSENADIVLGVPFVWGKAEVDGAEVSEESGLSDISLELKWRFYEKDGLSFALKPGITLPTGDDEKGLGSGKTAYGAFFITTKELKPVTLHMNLGYTRSENNADEREDIWHASLAGEFEATEKLSVVANVGVETNPDRASDTPPAFALAGIIYSVAENVNLDFGLKFGLNEPETDLTALAGVAVTF